MERAETARKEEEYRQAARLATAELRRRHLDEYRELLAAELGGREVIVS